TPLIPALWQFQQLGGLDIQDRCQLSENLQTGVIAAFFELAQIAAADLRLVSEIILREPSFVPQTAQIGGEHLSQVHARSEANCSTCAPRYTKQNKRLRAAESHGRGPDAARRMALRMGAVHGPSTKSHFNRLQRFNASGIFADDYGHKTLWDEFC